MPIFAKTFQELMTDGIADLSSNTTITRFGPGAMARSILESVNRRLGTAYEIFDLNMAKALVSAATGQWLDYIGAMLGVTRQPSQAAWADSDTGVMKFYVKTGTFGDINGGNDIFLSANTHITTLPFNAGIGYRVTQTTVLPAAASYVFVTIEANGTGENSNLGSDTLTYHDCSDYTDYLNGSLLCTNVHAIANGSNIEDDGNFKYRIVNATLEAEAANATAIRLAALSTPGVADIIVIPFYRGIGTFGIILKSITPTVSQGLIDSVAFNIEKIKAMGNVAYVRKPKETGVEIKLTVHYSSHLKEDELVNIETQIKNYLIDYINNIDIGDVLYVNPMAGGIFAISDKITNLGEPNKPIDELYVYRQSRLEDNKLRQLLLGDYASAADERIIIEPTLSNPITLIRNYVRR